MAVELTLELILLLLLAGLLAGGIDAIAGGGGLIALPALLFAGLTPAEALATNKLQGSFGTTTAALHFLRHGHVDRHGLRPQVQANLAQHSNDPT